MKCSKCCGDGQDVVEDECKEKLGAASNMICSFYSSVNRCVITTTASPQENTTNNCTSTYITRTSPSNSTVTSNGQCSTPYLSKTKTFHHWVTVSLVIPGAIIGDGDRKRGVHAKPSKKTNVLFLAKIAPPSTS